jgi:osmotically-inducible protein OsmY
MQQDNELQQETAMQQDNELQRDIIDELAWEPSIDAAAIGVAVVDGVVTLTGQARSLAEKWIAEHVTKRVAGVQAVANDIEIDLPGASQRTDADIARAALNALEWDVWVPHHRVTVTVSDGIIRLEGEVDTQYQKQAAERVIRYLTGVKGVTNLLRVKAAVAPADVKGKILAAFQRSAMIDARQIQVELRGDQAILRGRVRSWAERDTAEQAAWAAPGVRRVVDLLTIEP